MPEGLLSIGSACARYYLSHRSYKSSCYRMMPQDPLHAPRARLGPIRQDQVDDQECALTLHPAQSPHIMHTSTQGVWSVSDSSAVDENWVQSCLRSRLNRVGQIVKDNEYGSNFLLVCIANTKLQTNHSNPIQRTRYHYLLFEFSKNKYNGSVLLKHF